MDGLLTTQEAAVRAGVGTTAIKRWADSGILPCVRTAGGHRRFRERDVDALIREQGPSVSEAPRAGDALPQSSLGDAGGWCQLLVTEPRPHAIQARMFDERARLGSWARVASFLGQVLTEIGARWERGDLTVMEEHIASERLSRAITRAVESIPIAEQAPVALLACAEGDDHTLGLACAELCLREAGWSTRWAGRATPAGEIIAGLEAGLGDMVAASASSYSRSRLELLRWVNHVADACQRRGIPLVLGGLGAWPDAPAYGARFETFEAFRSYLLRLSRRD